MNNLPLAPQSASITNRDQTPRDFFPQMPTPENHEPGLDFRVYWNIIKRRKWMIILPLFIVPPLVAFGISLQKPTYEATATLLIDPVNPKILNIEEVLQPDGSISYYQTQYNLIRSRVIVERVIDTLNRQQASSEEIQSMGIIDVITDFPKTALRIIKERITGKGSTLPVDAAEVERRKKIVELQKAIEVYPVGNTRLVKVVVSGTDPHEITAQANTLAEVYVTQNLENKLEASKKARIWLAKEVTDLKEALRNADLALQDFLKSRGFWPSNLDEKQGVSLESFSDLKEAYAATKTQRTTLETQLIELEKLLKQSRERPQSLARTLKNPLIESLQQRYAGLEGELTILLKSFKEKHPKIIAIQAQMAQIESKIDAEVQKAIDSIKTEYNIILAREKVFEANINKEKTEAFKLNKEMTEYSALKRDVESKRALYQSMLSRLNETGVTEGLETNNIRIVERALVPIEPVPSKKMIKLAVSIVVACSFGVGSAFFLEMLNKGFKNLDEVEQYLKIPLLGLIPHYTINDEDKQPDLVTLREPYSIVSNCYRNVRANIQFFSVEKRIASLLITSAVPNEGKSSTVANLGVSFAQLGKSVLLVDADLRRPNLHKFFHLRNNFGLSDILINGEKWNQLIQQTPMENLKVLASGSIPNNPAELLGTTRMKTLCENLKSAFDLIIYDVPMILSIPDAATLAAKVDGVLLVYTPEQGNKATAAAAKQVLEKAHANLLGIVINNVDLKNEAYYSPQYYYDYYSETKKTQGDTERETLTLPMTLAENQDTWATESNVQDTAAEGSLATKIEKTRRNNGLTITIHNIRFTEEIADTKAEEGLTFLVVDTELSNESTSPYSFNTECTAIYVRRSSKYGDTVSRIYSLTNEQDSRRETNLCRCDPLTSVIENGLRVEETIAAKGMRRGNLVYKVSSEAQHYIFGYENGAMRITIPLTG
jgi:capsular exopolysaccharide synthesis family protein